MWPSNVRGELEGPCVEGVEGKGGAARKQAAAVKFASAVEAPRAICAGNSRRRRELDTDAQCAAMRRSGCKVMW